MNPTSNPFKPGSGIFPPYFAGRQREIEIFKKKLDSAIQNNFVQHMAILSGWGSGKTSLLIKFKEIAKEQNCSILPIQLYSIVEPRDFVELFVNSASFVVPPSNWQRFAEKISSFGISIMGSGIGLEQKSPYFEPQTAFQHSLKNIWKNSDASLIVVMVDDIQLITEREQTLEILRNVFTWSTNEGYKFMLLVAGTPDLFEKFQEAHAPLTRFFEPLILDPLSDEEIREAILKPLKDTKISFSSNIVEQIITLSEGNPFYVQLLSSHSFDHARDNKVSENEFKLAFISAINDISVRMFSKLFKSASPTEREILAIIYKSDLPLKWMEIVKKSKEMNIKESTAKPAIRRLLKAELIKQIEEGEYEDYYTLRDRLFREYLRTKLT